MNDLEKINFGQLFLRKCSSLDKRYWAQTKEIKTFKIEIFIVLYKKYKNDIIRKGKHTEIDRWA